MTMNVNIALVVLFLAQDVTGETILFIQGGVRKFRTDEVYKSEITNVTEVIGCPDNISLPNYPKDVFGSQLSYYNNTFWSCGGANFEQTFSECYAFESRYESFSKLNHYKLIVETRLGSRRLV